MERERSHEAARHHVEHEPAASTPALGVIQRTFIRHSKHVDNVLTPEGIALAEARCEALGNPRFDLMLASRQPRTGATGLLISPGTEVVVLPELYPDAELEQAIKAIYAEVGNFVLLEYITRLRAGGQSGTDRILEFGDRAAEAIERAAEQRRARNVLVMNHAPLISAVGLAYMTPDEPPMPVEVSAMMHTPLKECEGFVIRNSEPDFEWIGATPVYEPKPAL